ncbi:MAG TPA: aminoacyl-tRNA hydrolase [Candidatus Paceibacterota bacterium]|nr:aminoacyl-tRNA hydrolase [Candidatus Paceibacterota bacterium]
MYSIIALGNPGNQYVKTRHNAGFLVVDNAFSDLDWHDNKYAFAHIATAEIGNTTFQIAKPTTFMNESGKTADYLISKEGIDPENMIVIYDDLDLPLGKFKISFDRGNGGHNGIKSIEEHLGSREFIRIRIGISKVIESGELVKPNVLGNFDPSELELLQETANTVYKAIGVIISEGKEKAMTVFNQ